MRIARRLGGVLLLGALTLSCDSTEVAQVGLQIFEVQFSASGSQAAQLNVWQMYEDNDGDLQPDTSGRWLFCQSVSPAKNISATSVPWPFSVEISILPAGASEPTVLTSVAASGDGANRSSYDSLETSTVVTKSAITIDDNGTMRTFRFRNPRDETKGTAVGMTVLHRDVVAATSNPLSTFAPGTYGFLSGLCSRGDPGPSVVDGKLQPFSLEIRKGDTVTVQARKALAADPLLADFVTAEPRLVGTAMVDGATVNVRGTRSSGADRGDGLAFSFTAR